MLLGTGNGPALAVNGDLATVIADEPNGASSGTTQTEDVPCDGSHHRLARTFSGLDHDVATSVSSGREVIVGYGGTSAPTEAWIARLP